MVNECASLSDDRQVKTEIHMERNRATCMMHENGILMYSARAHNPYHGLGQSLQVKYMEKLAMKNEPTVRF